MDFFIKDIKGMNVLVEETKNLEKPSLFGMIFNPTEQFERIKERPLIWGAMVIVTILTIIGTWLMSLGIEIPEMEELPGMEVFAQITMIITGLFIPIFTVLISSFIYWIVIKIARSEATFKQLFSMNTYIMIISALSIIVNGALMAVFGGGDGESLFTSLGSLIPAEGAVAGLFESIEVFSIWVVVLSAIGLHKVAELSKGLAWGISIAFFIIGILFSMIGAGLSATFGV